MLVRSVVDATDPSPAYFHELRRVRVRANATAGALEVFWPGPDPPPLVHNRTERFNPDPRWPTLAHVIKGIGSHTALPVHYIRRAAQPHDCQRWFTQPATCIAPQ